MCAARHLARSPKKREEKVRLDRGGEATRAGAHSLGEEGLIAEDLLKAYPSVVAVGGVSFSIPHGSVHGLIGPNGAGKTTTLGMCAGIVRPTSGRVSLDGVEVGVNPLENKFKVAIIYDEPYLLPKLTGREHIDFILRLYGIWDTTRSNSAIERFELGGVIDKQTGGYSHGTKQRLALAIALARDPLVYLLDEPTVGLDPRFIREMRFIIAEEASRGKIVVLSTHLLEEAQGICDGFTVMDRGQVRATGDLGALQAAAGIGDGGTLEEAFFQLTTN